MKNIYIHWSRIYEQSRRKNIERLNAFNERVGIFNGSDSDKLTRLAVIQKHLMGFCRLLLFLIFSKKKKLSSADILILMEWGRYGKIDTDQKVEDYLRSINHELCNTVNYRKSEVAIFDPVLNSKARENSYKKIFDLTDVISQLNLSDFFSIVKLFIIFLVRSQKNMGFINKLRCAAAIVIGRKIIAKTRPKMVIMTTSNSYMTEGLRLEALNIGDDLHMVEILHGIPSLEIDEYHSQMLMVSKIWSNIKFIPKLNNLRMDPLYKCEGVSAINLTEKVKIGVDNKYTKDRTFIYLGVGGGNSHDVNYLDSCAFKLEMLYFKLADKWAKKNKLNLVKIYTFHPYRRTKENIEKFATEHPDVLLFTDSVRMWSVVDIFLTVYSSAIWEAEQYGAKVWFPVKASDSLFSKTLLGTRGMAESENNVSESLLKFLDNFKKEVL